MRMMMDAERKQAYLKALRVNGGNRTAAAAACSPHSTAKGASKPGYSSFKLAMSNDPEFAAEVAEVLEHVKGDIYAEIYKRAMNGTKEAVIQKGTQATLADGSAAWVTRYDNKLLLRLASKLDPDWSEKRTVTHDGEIVHKAGLSMSDIRALSPAERDQIEAAFTLLQNAREGGEPLAIEHNPEEAIDVAYEELDEEDTMACLDRLETEEG